MTPIIRYGQQWPDTMSEIQIELVCFRLKLDPERGGLGRLGHYRNICKILWPDHELTEWSDEMQTAFTGESRIPGSPLNIVVTGPASAAKSTEAAKLAVVWQQMAPLNSAVAVTSTSVKMAKKRIWAEIKAMWELGDKNCKKRCGHGLAGHLVDSSCELMAKPGDNKHAIAIVPGSPKYSKEGTKKLQGWHAEYVLVLADELQDMTEEVIDACVNMQSGTKEFIFIGIGNGNSWLNTLGRAMMPISGNPEDVSVDDKQWETKDGICLHFDGLESPNIKEPGKYPWLVSQKQIDVVIRKHGEDSVQFWQMVRGFPPPDGSVNAVVSESMIIKFHCMEQSELVVGGEKYAGLDTAFGGDRCVLKFADVGLAPERDRKLVVFEETVAIKVQASVNEPIDYQIANQVKAECQARGVKPENFSVDATGTGRGVAAILRREWSNLIHVVEFGGAASDMPVSKEDSTKACDAYANRSTELWFSFRTFCVQNQVRGLTQDCAREFGARTYTTKGRKVVIATKTDVKAALGRSPDDADASVLIVDNLRSQGFFAGPLGFSEGWEKLSLEQNNLEAGYAATDDLLNT